MQDTSQTIKQSYTLFAGKGAKRTVALEILERYRPDEHHESVAAMGPERVTELIDDGRTLWISDIDGTAGANGSFDIDEETLAVYRTIADDPRATSVLWTNNEGKTEDERTRMQWFAETLHAKYVTFKDAPDETKPAPTKIYAIIERENNERDPDAAPITTANTVMMGDKLTADGLAGYYARGSDPQVDGVHTIWVDRLGDPLTDLKGDLFLRRPAEYVIWKLLGEKGRVELEAEARSENSDARTQDGASNIVVEDIADPPSYGRSKLPKTLPKVEPDILSENSLIANIGNGPTLEISDELFDTIPPPWTEPIYEVLRGIKNSAVVQAIENRAAEHGKDDANIVTLVRLAGIVPVAGAILLKKPKLAAPLYTAFATSDVVDGYLARVYKQHHPDENGSANDVEAVSEMPEVEGVEEQQESATPYSPQGIRAKSLAYFEDNFVWEEGNTLGENARQSYKRIKEKVSAPGWGARWDPIADKWLANVSGAALTVRHPEMGLPFAATVARDLYRERIQRPNLLEQGFTSEDLSATTSSKASSFVLNDAMVTSMFDVSARTRFLVHAVAAADKWYSAIYSKPVWERRKQFREDAAEKRAILTEMYTERASSEVMHGTD